MFQDVTLNSDLKQSYVSSFLKDSSFSHDPSKDLKGSPFRSYDFSRLTSKTIDQSSSSLQKNSITFLKCPKHPMFDMLLICLEKKCNFSPAICKICLTDTHMDHRNMNLVDFLKNTKELISKKEGKTEKKFMKLNANIKELIQSLCGEYNDLIVKMKEFIHNMEAKMKSDFDFFWKSLQEYPPFKFLNIIKKIENNSINTVRVLNSSLNFLLDYEIPEKKMKNEETESEIEDHFNSIVQNMKFNQEKLNKSKEQIEEIINSINLDKIPLFHSANVPKNDNMLRNEGASGSKYLEDVLNPNKEFEEFDDSLTKFTQKQVKKVKFSDFPSNTTSFLFKRLPLAENKKFFQAKSILMHKAPIFNLAYLNDMSCFVSVSADHTIKIYDLRNDKITTTLYSHLAPVNDVLYLRKSDILATSSADSTVKLWSSKTFMLIRSFEAHEIWSQPMISLYDESVLVTGGGDDKIKLWDMNTGKSLNVYEHHRKGVNGLTSLEDQSAFLSYSYDNTMTLWDTRRNSPVCTYKNDGDFFNKVLYIPDGDVLIAASQDGMMKAFMRNNLMSLMSKRAHLGSCNALEYFYDGKTMVSAGDEGMIKFWNCKTFELGDSIQAHKEAVQCLCYLNNSKGFLSGSVDKTVKMWET